ncbi:hypothetical protein L917_01989 [Phytophthora nicotianae]|uniref:Uncharacterized protein n=4 Tax=Phytophthora nicotianae TaxID=4792 RepID=W2PF49_PHYN3|nr:hypothetical protein PPTG_19257 [Phytophthora nicotianae INRA-310]ETI55121.1 hypothetical protein F443_02183 [Phytophthora nicotianae P1569]ETK94958.1 hypothetical protein L915_02081 [Phytophthora nicotianae]ETO83865.1 hypothetical protein F444_02189 [Phytophthora nicotianae P1976]KUF90724.1 hypothetical protein AM587_10016309 [Phytophthora nicotianae]ETL48342.1 hypothetical protein L916_02051 [Phytophthora nicotianae]
MNSIKSRRRSLSESCKFAYLATQAEHVEKPHAFMLAPEEPVDDHHPLVLSVHQGGESLAALEYRSKSESFICTAQGIVFQDTKCQKYHSKLDRLVALANSSSTQSNVLLAKKALRYRKVLERRCVKA